MTRFWLSRCNRAGKESQVKKRAYKGGREEGRSGQSGIPGASNMVEVSGTSRYRRFCCIWRAFERIWWVWTSFSKQLAAFKDKVLICALWQYVSSWCIRELLQGLVKTHFWLLVPEMLLHLDLGRGGGLPQNLHFQQFHMPSWCCDSQNTGKSIDLRHTAFQIVCLHVLISKKKKNLNAHPRYIFFIPPQIIDKLPCQYLLCIFAS